MKIIELLNMISKGEEVPNIILFNSYKYRFDKIDRVYRNIRGNSTLGEINELDLYLNDEVEIIEENNKELHANNIEFNINNDKRDCIITLDENDLGIDKLHLDNCYFYKENDKWYVKHINLKPIAYISPEHKIPKKIFLEDMYSANEIKVIDIELENKINEIIDYLEEIK